MDTIAEIISRETNILTATGNRRCRFLYDMDVALELVKMIGRDIVPDFVMTPEVESVYRQLIQYFYADPEFYGDVTRGLLLMGPTGTGKTLAMNIMRIYRKFDNICFSKNGKAYQMNFDITPVNDIVNGFMENAFDGIHIYCCRYVACLDDIGTEIEDVKYYGNTLDVIAHVLSERYSKRLLTFGTTNCTLDRLEERYGDRIISRMYALFNFIVVKGKDFRRD